VSIVLGCCLACLKCACWRGYNTTVVLCDLTSGIRLHGLMKLGLLKDKFLWLSIDGGCHIAHLYNARGHL